MLHVNGVSMDRLWWRVLVDQNASTLAVLTGLEALPVPRPFAYPNLKQLHVNEYNEKILAACPKLQGLQIRKQTVPAGKSGVRLEASPAVHVPGLRRLTLWDRVYDHTEFLTRNAATLTSFDIRCIYSSTFRAAVQLATQLTHFRIRDMDERTNLSFLSADLMRGMHIHVSPNATAVTLSHIADTLSRLTCLTDFSLSVSSRDTDLEKRNAIVTLFDHVRSLQNVSICVQLPKNVELLVERLVRNNGKLRSIRSEGVEVTDPVLDSVSDLPCLQSIVFERESSFSTDGVVKLMTGLSGSSLTSLKIVDAGPDVDMDMIGEQFVAMMRSRGLTPRPEKWEKNVQTRVYSFL